MTLLRASMVFPSQTFTTEVSRLSPNHSSHVRLLQAENICTAAARATIHRVLELADHGIQSLILSATQPLLAIIALALHILKNPSKRMVRSDLELLTTAIQHLGAQFSRGGQHSRFIQGLHTLRRSLSAAVELQSGSNSARSASVSDNLTSLGAATATNGHDAMPILAEHSLLMSEFMPEATAFGLNENMPFEELWGSIGTYSFLGTTLTDEPLL